MHEDRELGTHEDGRGADVSQASRACIRAASAYRNLPAVARASAHRE